MVNAYGVGPCRRRCSRRASASARPEPGPPRPTRARCTPRRMGYEPLPGGGASPRRARRGRRRPPARPATPTPTCLTISLSSPNARTAVASRPRSAAARRTRLRVGERVSPEPAPRRSPPAGRSPAVGRHRDVQLRHVPRGHGRTLPPDLNGRGQPRRRSRRPRRRSWSPRRGRSSPGCRGQREQPGPIESRSGGSCCGSARLPRARRGTGCHPGQQGAEVRRVQADRAGGVAGVCSTCRTVDRPPPAGRRRRVAAARDPGGRRPRACGPRGAGTPARRWPGRRRRRRRCGRCGRAC
jgi:hypothetical protein